MDVLREDLVSLLTRSLFDEDLDFVVVLSTESTELPDSLLLLIGTVRPVFFFSDG